MRRQDLADAFNEKFGTNNTLKSIVSALKNHKITCGRTAKERFKSGCRLYTPEESVFLANNYTGKSIVELTQLFNDRFERTMTQQQIKSFVHNRGITSGRTGRFEKGQVSWNKGKKGYMGPNVTSFKKGNSPANLKPLYTERIDTKDGFILIKVPERDPHTGFPTRYKHKHVWVWEQSNGPVPKGMKVAFRDGDKSNCDPGNLMLVSSAELLSMNLHGYRTAPEELKPTILALAKMEAKAGIRLRPARRGKKKNNPVIVGEQQGRAA